MGLLMAGLVIILDQASKFIVRDWLEGGAQAILPFLNFVTAWNPGVAFSFLADGGNAGKWFLTVTALIVSLVLLRWLFRAENILAAVGIGLVIGGALGNVIDRLIYGAVFDFIDVFWGNYHWPAFNIADSSITIGVTFLLIDGLFPKAKSAK